MRTYPGGHVFLYTHDTKQYRDPVVYTDDEFATVMDELSWRPPKNLGVKHFSLAYGPVAILDRPTLAIPVLDLPRQKLINDRIYVHYRRYPSFRMKLLRRLGDFVLVDAGEIWGDTLLLLDGYMFKLQSRYRPKPISLQFARQYVQRHHRHNAPPKFHKFSVGLEAADGQVVGVAIASEPKARMQCDGSTLEVNRVCTDPQYHNVCSCLYRTVVRIGREMGYHRFLTYTLASESGASLRAAGFHLDGRFPAASNGWSQGKRSWVMPDKYPQEERLRWVLQID